MPKRTEGKEFIAQIIETVRNSKEGMHRAALEKMGRESGWAVKSVEMLSAVHKKQLLTYLRLTDKRLGLLINFQVALIKDGITRIVNGLEEETRT